MSRSPHPVGPVGHLVAANIRDLRKEQRISQELLTEKVAAQGVTLPRSSIATTEAARRLVDVDELIAFADALGVSPLRLLGRPGDGSFAEGYDAGWQACRKAMLDATYRTVPEGT